MAKQSRKNNLKVWTFELITGPSFRLDLPHNPSLKFEGCHTIWKMVGTTEMAIAVENIIKSCGVTARVFTEEQTPEQKLEREELLKGKK